MPLVFVERRYDRRGSGWQFGKETIGVGFVDDLPVLHTDSVFVLLANSDLWDEQFPDSGRILFLHAMGATIPMIEVADNLNTLRIGSPDGEINARVAVDLTNMRAELLVNLPMLARIEEVTVKVADQAWYSVWILHFNCLSARIRKSKSVLWWSGVMLRHQSFVQPGWMNATHRSSCRIAFIKQPRLIKAWKIASNSDSVFAVNTDNMRSQNALWVRSHSVN